MDEKLAKALGITIVKKRRGGGRSRVDVAVMKYGSRYTLSFSPSVRAKLGSYVKVGIGKKRIYLVPSANDGDAFKIAGNNTGRGYLNVARSTVGFIDDYVGDHELRYDGDLDAYFITTAKEVEV